MTNDYEAFVKDRQKGIGGSDISAIMGLNKYQTIVDVYLSKTEPINIDQNGNEFTRTGQLLEDYVAKRFTMATNLPVETPSDVILSDKEYPYFRASLDRQINADTVFEIKTTRLKIEEPLHTWLLQVQWYMGVTDRKQAVICWITLPTNFDYENFVAGEYDDKQLSMFDLFTSIEWRTIERDDNLIALMRQKGYEFWNNHVIPRVPPEPTIVEDVAKLYPFHEAGKSLTVTSDIYDKYCRLGTLRQEIKELEVLETEILDDLKMLFADNESIDYEDKVLATYKAQVTNRFDSTRFKKDHTDLYEQYVKSTTSRVLRLK